MYSQQPMTSRNHLHNITSVTMCLLITTSLVYFSDLCLNFTGMSAVSCQKYKYLPACAFIEISSDMFVSLKGNTTEISIGVCFSEVPHCVSSYGEKKNYLILLQLLCYANVQLRRVFFLEKCTNIG